MRTFIAADTETTGFSPAAGDRIVEVALLRFVDGKVSSKYVSLIQPQRAIPSFVTSNIHGISDEMVSKSPTFGEALPGILDFISDDPVVFHNAGFDMAFLETESMLAGGEWPSSLRVFDTLEIARKSRLFNGSHSLEVLSRGLGLVQGFHRAEADAYATGYLLLHLMRNGVEINPWK
jgi:DNA polymerase-3 subunit epsilon